MNIVCGSCVACMCGWGVCVVNMCVCVCVCLFCVHSLCVRFAVCR